MPELTRRHLLQVTGAAGLAPLIPLPAAAIPAATPSQMMWANLYAQAGNARTAAGLASAMHIPLETARGLCAGLSPVSVATSMPKGPISFTKNGSAQVRQLVADELAEASAPDAEPQPPELGPEGFELPQPCD